MIEYITYFQWYLNKRASKTRKNHHHINFFLSQNTIDRNDTYNAFNGTTKTLSFLPLNSYFFQPWVELLACNGWVARGRSRSFFLWFFLPLFRFSYHTNPEITGQFCRTTKNITSIVDTETKTMRFFLGVVIFYGGNIHHWERMFGCSSLRLVIFAIEYRKGFFVENDKPRPPSFKDTTFLS